MRKLTLVFVAATLGAAAMAEPALAQQNEQFLPSLVYRTGPYAPNGIPFADGVSDYWTLLNERDGGINGVKLLVEECETGYATDKGVECYERLKGKGPTGAAFVNPLSTEAITHLEFIIFGSLICYLLIKEPHGFARLISIGKEKLRLWPFPY